MNISLKHSANNLSFQKTLVARAGILTNGKTENVNIYHLDKKSDIEDINKASSHPNWRGNYFLNMELLDNWKSYYRCCDIYTMENKEKDILCYSAVDNKGIFNKKLELLETAPKISRYNSMKRKSKYIGETMLAFIASKLGNKNLAISCVNDEYLTLEFYNYCKFEPHGFYGAILKKNKAEELIKQNFQHTGKKIEIIKQ